MFGSDCGFSTHTSNAKKLGMNKCSMPVKNYPMESVKNTFGDMICRSTWIKSTLHTACPLNGIVSAKETEKELLKKEEKFEKQSSDPRLE